MAEDAGDPASEGSGDDLSKRIANYFASPQAQEHFLQGFASAGGISSSYLQYASQAESEDHRKRLALGQGKLHQGGPSGKALKNPDCRAFGHRWHEVGAATSAHLLVEECTRCGTVRKRSARSVKYSYTQEVGDGDIDTVPAPEEWDEEEASRICIWCGKVCESLDALDAHEEECEP